MIPEAGPFTPEEIDVENNQAIADWFRSAHANAAAEAFRHWDEDRGNPPACAICHSGEGFQSTVSTAASPASPRRPSTRAGSSTARHVTTRALRRSPRSRCPSGLMHPVNGVEASCMTCHQGRTAGVTVAEAVGDLPDDSPNPELRFVNPHYATAAASMALGHGAAGYHYEDATIPAGFSTPGPSRRAVSCHQPHTLEVAFEPCLTCHEDGRNAPGNTHFARQAMTAARHLGGHPFRHRGESARLLEGRAIETYATDVAEEPIVYDENALSPISSRMRTVTASCSRRPKARKRSPTAHGPRAAFAPPTIGNSRPSDQGNLLPITRNTRSSFSTILIEDLTGPLDVDMEGLGL